MKAALCIDLLKPSHPLPPFPWSAALRATTENWFLSGKFQQPFRCLIAELCPPRRYHFTSDWCCVHQKSRVSWCVSCCGPPGSLAAAILREAVQGKWDHGDLCATSLAPWASPQDAAVRSVGRHGCAEGMQVRHTNKYIFLLQLWPQRQHWWDLLLTARASLSGVNISLFGSSSTTNFSSLRIDENHFWQTEERRL